jgi:hypothetical protein
MSTPMSALKRNNLIREACRRAGWKPTRTYSDKRKNDKRISFTRTEKVSKRKQAEVAEAVFEDLMAAGVDFDLVYWTRSKRDYLYADIYYDKLVVTV